ncbi:TolC family outer membrane protein [Chachezhania sediminis]|uniref:TolC family outer membrane protein n=1 Tax=Chachezhania sediminis TaxID=2599291 RepID=UPI00131E17C5|nr:TolC family outer membrane protein [Chachezhania sediminis]
MRKVWAALTGCGLGVAMAIAPIGFTGTARADNMADALVGAYNTSGLLEQNRALLRAADEGVAQSVSLLRPILAWSASASRTAGDLTINGINAAQETSPLNLQLTLSLLLFDFGATQQNINSAKQTVLATQQTLISVEQQVLYAAVSAYLNLLLAQEYVGVQRNNLNVLQEQLKATQDRFDVGAVTRTDVALAQSQLAAAQSSLESARGDLLDAQAAYEAAVGHLPTSAAGFPPLPSRPDSVDKAISVALTNHPNILSSQYQIKAADYSVAQAQRSLRGEFALSGSAGVGTNLDLDRDVNTGTISLGYNQTIYQGGGLSATIRRAKANRDAAKGALITSQRNVVQGVRNAYEAISVARANISATNQQVEAASVAAEGLREEAKLGSRTTLDVLTAEQDLLDAQIDQITARIGLYTASYQLLQAQGLLTAANLRLPVTIYDPNAYYNLAKTAPTNLSKRGKQLDQVLQRLGK